MTKTYSLRLFLALVCLAGGSAVVHAQRFSIECKDRYFLGETPTIKINITNTSRSPKKVKEAEYRKFYIEMTGRFDQWDGQHKKKAGYDGSWFIPELPSLGGIVWMSGPTKRPAKYVTLGPGESTTLTMDLSRTFGAKLGVSKYRLAVKSSEGQTIVREFEVYFDNEKTIPILAEMVETGNEQGWGVSYMAQFNVPRYIALLEEIAARNPERREHALGLLWDVRGGNGESIQLRINSKERYSLNETPTITISLQSNLETPQTVIEPQQQRFSLELRRTLPNESTPESRTCVYTPKEPSRKPKLVTLPSYDDLTSFSLNLQDCFGGRLEAGNYELIVKGLDQKELKYQIAVQKFQIVAEND